MNYLDSSSGVYYLNSVGTAYIESSGVFVVKVPKVIYLPVKPNCLTKITLFNQSGNLITIDTNFKSDLIHSSFFAPQGSKTITMENHRMVVFTFLIMDDAKRSGFWFVNTS